MIRTSTQKTEKDIRVRDNALSRRPDYDQGTEDNTNVTVLPKHVFAKATTTIIHQHCQDEECLNHGSTL
jgi:hypothetical protein